MAILCRDGVCANVPNDIDLDKDFEKIDIDELEMRRTAFLDSLDHSKGAEHVESERKRFGQEIQGAYDARSKYLHSVTLKGLETLVSQSSTDPGMVIVVEFGGAGCTGCHEVAYALSELARQTGRKIYKTQGDSDWLTGIFAQMPIAVWKKANEWDDDAVGKALETWGAPMRSYIPFVAAFKGGAIVDAYPMNAARTPAAYEAWIAHHTGPWWQDLEQEKF